MMQENQISPLPPKKEDSERRTRWPSHNCLLSKTEGAAARCAQEGRYSMSRGRGSSCDESRTESRPPPPTPPIEVSFNMGYRLENRYSCSSANRKGKKQRERENDGFTIGFVFLTPTSVVRPSARAAPPCQCRADRQLQFHTPLVTPPYIIVQVSSPN